jgi:periplasmic divalent cation tolerance protein
VVEPIVVLVTASSSEEAAQLAQAMVNERVAACVNIVPGLSSIYRWQGRVETADEVLLIVKTARHLLPAVTRLVQSLHSYTVPEVIALPIVGGAAPYLDWLAEQVRSEAEPGAGPAGESKGPQAR